MKGENAMTKKELLELIVELYERIGDIEKGSDEIIDQCRIMIKKLEGVPDDPEDIKED